MNPEPASTPKRNEGYSLKVKLLLFAVIAGGLILISYGILYAISYIKVIIQSLNNIN